MLYTEKLDPSVVGIERVCNYTLISKGGKCVLEIYNLSEIKSYLSKLHIENCSVKWETDYFLYEVSEKEKI